MAADSSINETDAAPAAAEDKSAALREPSGGPPRPPRPAKRASGSVRIPLPSSVTPGSKLNGATRVEIAGAGAIAPLTPLPSTPALAVSSAPAPALVLPSASTLPTPLPTARSTSTRPPAALVSPEVPGEPAGNIEFALTRRSSAAPPLSFDSAEVDPSDRAPIAPLTPWRDVPPLKVPTGLDSLPAATAREDQDHEDTMVGEVPKNLLDLSIENEDENTRAYQAPQELIDLARRQRQERQQAQNGSGKKRDPKAAFRDSLSPSTRGEAAYDQSDVSTATVPLDTIPSGDAAPPVARSRPVRGTFSEEPNPAPRANAGEPSLLDLAREVSERRLPESLPVMSAVPPKDAPPESALPSLSKYRTPWLTRARIWGLFVGVFVIVGYALARWRGLDLLLPH